MADQSDVEQALVGLISSALYPWGTSESSIAGPECRIYRGWPNSSALDADLAAGVINVTVFPAGPTGAITTRFSEQWVGNPGVPALTITAEGNSVTFAGRGDAGQIAGVLVDGIACAYRTTHRDTPQLVAANLAALLRERSIVQLSHATLTFPGAGSVLARVVTDAQVRQEVRRQEQEFRVTCWCPTPTTRDAAATAIDEALSVLRFIPLGDASVGRLSYSGTTVFDQSQNAKLYRRDLAYTIEFPTIISSTNPSMLFGNLKLNTATFTA